MAPMATTTKALGLLFMALLPLTTMGSRAGPSAHRSHGPKHSPPASTPSPPPPPTPAPPATLVRSTCNSTTYPDLCVSTLSADPSSATADVRGLSAIAVAAATANASGGAATAAALASANVVNNATGQQGDATVEALLRTCAAKYGEARDALAAARESVAAQDYDYASVHVSAAAEYPRVCRALFQRQRPGEYPPELAAREDALRQLCTVSLDIITLLLSNN